ncbi:MAG TPA: type IV pili twitching motility protein PilT, partial [Alphaproteobacteria bacterium]|nr:type IV pili twitching motility protein PilT [Alphaproteobacteria bacterium]
MMIDGLLRQMIDERASDLFIKAKQVPFMRVDGTIRPLGSEPISVDSAAQMAREIIGEGRWAAFEAEWECDTAYEAEEMGRFRVNAFKQTGKVSLSIRRISNT